MTGRTRRVLLAAATACALACADGSIAAADPAGSSAPADDAATRPLSLGDALAVARAHNDTYLGEATDVERAAADVRSAAGVDDLIVEGGVSAASRSQRPVDGPFFQETDAAALAARAAVWQPLPWGGRIGFELSEDVARSTVRVTQGGPPIDFDTTVHSTHAELVWMQPLLRDRGRTSHQAGRRLATAAAGAEDAERAQAETELVLDVTRAYWELSYAERELVIRASSLDLARSQLDITRARADVGRTAELEVLAVEQAIAAREAALIAARQARDERALELRVLMALDDGDGRRLAAADPLDADLPDPDLAGAQARALAYSPLLRALDHRAEAAGIAAGAAGDDLRPRLDLVVRGGPAGQSDGPGEAWSQLGRFDGYQASAALTFQLPVANRVAVGRRDAARATARRLAHDRAAVRGRLIAEVARAADAVALSSHRIAAAAKAAELAARNVALERDRWQSGAGTNFDVLTRQDQAAAADAALARARVDRRLAIAALAALTGP